MKFVIKRIIFEIRWLLDDVIYFPVRFYKNHFTGWAIQHFYYEPADKHFYFCPKCGIDLDGANPKKRCFKCNLLLDWNHIK